MLCTMDGLALDKEGNLLALALCGLLLHVLSNFVSAFLWRSKAESVIDISCSHNDRIAIPFLGVTARF